MQEAIALAGGLVDPETPEARPVRVEITQAWNDVAYERGGPWRVTVGKQHFRPLKSGGYNVAGIAAAIVKGREAEAVYWRREHNAQQGKVAAIALLVKAWKAAGFPEIERLHPNSFISKCYRGVRAQVLDDGTVRLEAKWQPPCPEGWHTGTVTLYHTANFDSEIALTAGLLEAVRLAGTGEETS
jgi:hypothetical protein